MIQSRLNTLYEKNWKELNTVLPKDRGISNPLFIRVPEAYEKAELKLMVIGKETNSWWSDLGDPTKPTTPEKLVDCYRDFNLGEKYVKSPFWWAAHQLQSKLSAVVPPFGFVWSNLFICDQNKRTPENDIADKLRTMSVLQAEIDILQPHAIVFFTGWNPYDYTIDRLFQGNDKIPINGDGKLLAQLSHRGLPISSFRTYHPKYLRLKKQMFILDVIAEKIMREREN